MSTSAGPIHRVARYAGGRVELWLTPCAVSMPPPGSTCLLVPSNERLCGTQFSHFPVGGPTPPAPLIGERREAEIPMPRRRTAQNIIYPCEAVDGAVAELGGPDQEREVRRHAPVCGGDDEYPIRCPTGRARRVPAVGMLGHFDSLILAVAPFWPGEPSLRWECELRSAYLEGFQLAHGTLAAPLLGAGARGAPVVDAARVAANATRTFFDGGVAVEDLEVVRFSVLDEDVAEALDDQFLGAHPE